jgi:diadenylate cyclase
LQFLRFIPTPTWRDLVDILFLTLVAYHLYVWFRETRALRVIIGLVVLGAIYSVAKAWDLILTTWVFQILWQVLIILLLILFQAEIRQVLEKVSPLRYLQSRRRVLRSSFTNDLSQVVFNLAAENTGALIVVTRDENPSEFILGGQSIMALPEPALIKSIFNRDAPAHDGAIVISQERITQIGCILPLSERDDLPEKYGTRHRAALGLSEVTDVVCLVVSEERSEVSSVVDGKITVWQEPEALAAKLKEWLGGPEIHVPSLKQFFKQAFIKNWKTKLGALVLVSIAWMILAIQEEMKVNITAQVHYTHISSELALDSGSTRSVNLTLIGRGNTIKDLSNRGVRVQIDLNKFSAGEHSVRISSQDIDLPVGVEIERVTPESVSVNLKPLTYDRVGE